jgi:hypothetical protein
MLKKKRVKVALPLRTGLAAPNKNDADKIDRLHKSGVPSQVTSSEGVEKFGLSD